MNRLNHVAFIMDGNGRWGEKKVRAEILAISKVFQQLKKLLKQV